MPKKKMYASERILEEFYEALADQNESRLRSTHTTFRCILHT